MKIYLSALLICIAGYASAQTSDEYWAKWNKNYAETDVTDLLRQERHYADSVEHHPAIAPYYFRRDSYRFIAKFLGKAKPADAEMTGSMKRVLKSTGRDPNLITNLVDSSVLVKVGAEELWMPIQKKLLPMLREEVAAGAEVTLYCLFLNEHTQNKQLFNSFLISEFAALTGKE